MSENMSGARIAEELLARPGGATMREIIEATGGPQYNKLKQLEARGFAVEKVREGRETRYFARPPAKPSYGATVTGKGQVTIPGEVRRRLGLRAGTKIRFVIEADDRVVVAPGDRSIRRLFGILGKPPRSATVEEMKNAVRDAAVDRFRRAVGKRK